MSYCSKCGSYIPDSALTCPACGRPKFNASATAQEQQAKSQSYGQSARQQAETQRPRTPRRPRREEHPYESAPGENTQSTASQAYRYSYDYDERAYEDFDQSVDNENGENNVLSALGYLGPLVLIPLLTKRDSAFVRFHSNQSLALIIFSILCNLAGAIVPGVGWIASTFGGLFSFYGIIKGMSNALRGKMEKLPLIGDFKILGNHGGEK